MDFGYDDWEEGLETPLVDDCDDDNNEEEEYEKRCKSNAE